MKKYSRIINSALATGTALVLPIATFAATRIGDILLQVKSLMDLFIPIFVTLGLLYFLVGLTEYILSSSEGGQTEGRNRIIYGILGLFVMVAVWGLVGVVANTFGIQGGGSVSLPSVVPVQ